MTHLRSYHLLLMRLDAAISSQRSLSRMAPTKPFDLLVIGGGSGGIACARRAAEFGIKVGLIESHRLGGTCVNVGCVPKKVMFHAAQHAEFLHEHQGYGFNVKQIEPFNWSFLKAKRDAYVKRLNDIYQHNLEKSKVEIITGRAKFLDQNQIMVNNEQYFGKQILIATGGYPVVPDIPGSNLGITSDGFFELTSLPKKSVVVGAGYIGVEIAGILNALGSEVFLIIRGNTVLRSFDDLISDTVTENLIHSGVKVITNSEVSHVQENLEKKLSVTCKSGDIFNDVDCLLWAIGRKPHNELALQKAKVNVDSDGFIIVDEYQNTSQHGIYALGDVCGKWLLTPVAIAAGRKLAHRLFDNKLDSKLNYNLIPTVIFSHPPVGTIGVSHKEAVETYGKNNVKVYETKFVPLYYSMLEKKSYCRMKLICTGVEEKIVGLHMIGQCADEILQGFGVAIKMGATKSQFDDCVAIHPTVAEELVTMR